VRLVNRVIEGFEDLVVAVGLAIATIATIAEVIARFVFSTSTGTGGELTTIFIIWAAMIGAAVAARSGVHIGVDVLVKQMPAPAAKLIVLASLLISALFTGWVAWLGIGLVQFSYGTQQQTMELLWPRWPLFLSVPVGMGLMTYHLLQEVFHRLGQPAEMFLHDIDTESTLEANQELDAAHPGT
jgi:TRAP-type C4-dicarboxylate transport system permease small subunit